VARARPRIGVAVIRETAPAKVNLVLHVGDARDDGLHELCSLFASLELADELTIEPLGGAAGDEVVCAGVAGPNLAERAIDELRRELGGDALPPLRVTIDKHIPVAAGLGGGSADAAAVLRAANAIAGEPLDADALRAVGARIGADVPSQITPRHALVTGAGEGVEAVELAPLALVLVPQNHGLSTADVYREADRIGSTRARLDAHSLRTLAGAPLADLAAALENDLERAALSLRPELAAELEALREAGALAARITGSGPTAYGVFATRAAAEHAAAGLQSRSLVTVTRHQPQAQ
jgi:4-diphosphocytidyl-2-C-methyl-D-erythritol kinase